MLDYAQFIITRGNYNSRYNGLGCIRGVLDGTALAPMQYRVAIPWIYRIFPHYEIIKIGLMACGLFSMWLMFETIWGAYSYQAMLITGIFYVINFQYDYAEQYLELSMWAQFLTAVYIGNIPWMVACLVIASLCRETSVFLPLVYFLATGSVVTALVFFAVVGGTLLMPRIIYGIKPSYLDAGVKVGGVPFRGKNHLFKNIDDVRSGLKWMSEPS